TTSTQPQAPGRISPRATPTRTRRAACVPSLLNVEERAALVRGENVYFAVAREIARDEVTTRAAGVVDEVRDERCAGARTSRAPVGRSCRGRRSTWDERSSACLQSRR